jgi:UDP-GlcNAc3NAcA epimerase
MKKVLTIVGARPQFIKAAPVSRALAAAHMIEYLVHTGQHYDTQMSDVFFIELGIRVPDLNLNVGSGSHGAQTGAMLAALERAILEQKPDWVLVYGDTNSTLAGALAAAKLNVRVAHVEAGLRSFNRRMPEEVNRVVVDAISSILFVPSETGRQNLLREGTSPERITWTGDVMYDAMLLFRNKAVQEAGILDRLGINGGPFVLATVHRAENTDDPVRLQAIVRGLQKVAEEVRVILPLHPRTRSRLAQMPQVNPEPVEIIDPVGFLDMMRLEGADNSGSRHGARLYSIP